MPEIASRQHLVVLNPLIEEALRQAGVKLHDLNAIAVAHGPGLVGALLVGVATAKALAYAARLPLIAVNHLQAHLYANHLCGFDIKYPAVVLVVSGGHTELLYSEEPGSITLLGHTRDDAAGEAFDKVARALELGYPGGPIIDSLAEKGNPAAIDFPRALMNEEGRFDFSFSGLKTAVINHLYHARRQGHQYVIADVVASFQEALVDALVEKTVSAAKAHKAATVLIAGGVAANSRLRFKLKERLGHDLPYAGLYVPPLELCTDNAAMIAAAAYPLYRQGRYASLDLNAYPGLGMGDL